MYYKKTERNQPIKTLLRLYLDKNSGKVSYARREIQKRFDFQDWGVQKKIVAAFLQSGKSDREWIYGKVYSQWDKSFYEPMKALWEQYHEEKCAWSIITHFPLEYVKENAALLEAVNGYYHLCMRFADDPSYVIDKKRLSGRQYLLALLNSHRSIEHDEARDVFFEIIHKFCLTSPLYIYNNWRKRRGYALSISDIKEINSITYILELLNQEELLTQIRQWDQEAMNKAYAGPELQALDKDDPYDNNYEMGRLAIAQYYMYQALDEKYKQSDNEETKKELKSRVEYLHQRDYRNEKPTDTPPTNDPRVIQDMMEQNPAVAHLIGSFGLTDESNQEGGLPF